MKKVKVTAFRPFQYVKEFEIPDDSYADLRNGEGCAEVDLACEMYDAMDVAIKDFAKGNWNDRNLGYNSDYEIADADGDVIVPFD